MILLELGTQGFYLEKHIKYFFYDIDDAFDTIEEGHIPALVGGRAGYILFEDENGERKIYLFKGGYIEYDGKILKVALREYFDPQKLDLNEILETLNELNKKLAEVKDEKERKKLEEEIITNQKLYFALAKVKSYFEK